MGGKAMLRNKGLATAVLITACGLGLLWRFSTSTERPRHSARVEAADSRGSGSAELAENAPSSSLDRAPADAEDRAKLEVPAPVPATNESGAFEADAAYGRVLDPEGMGVAGARVLLFEGLRSLEHATAPLDEAVSDENGRYRFQGLDIFRGYQIHVEAEGFLPRVSRTSPGHDDEAELARAVTVEGQVLDASTGNVLAGVQVRNDVGHWSTEGYQRFVATTTDEQGRYQLPWARTEGMQRVLARRPGHAFETREFQVDERRSDGYDLRLGEGRPLLLEVYDLDTGVPYADTRFELSRGHFVETDGTGRIDLTQVLHPKARDRSVNLVIGGEGWCRTSINFPLQKDGPPQLLRVPVTRGGKIRGRVLDGEGAPVEGALVRYGQQRGRSRRRAPRRGDLPDNVWIGNRDDPVLSDAEGRFELVAVYPSTNPVRVFVSHPAYADERQEDILLSSPGEVVEVEFELTHGGIIQGVVTVDEELVSTTVTWNSEDGNGWTRSNDLGEFRFRGVSPGEVKLNATLDDKSWSNRQSDPETVWVEDGETLTHDLTVTSNRSAITGTVLELSGDPIANAEVIAWASDDQDFHFSTSTNSDEEGRFELLVEAVPGILYELYAMDGARYETMSGVNPGSQGIELTLPELGAIRLAVQDSISGDPVEGFSIFWRPSENEGYRRLHQGSASFSPGPDGSFEAELAVGTVDLIVTARELGYAAEAVPQVRVESPSSDRPVPVRMTRGVMLEVVFVYDEGTQSTLQNWMRRRRVAITNDEQRAFEKNGGEYFQREVRYGQALRPDDSGRTRVKGLAPGNYGFVQTPNELAFHPDRFEVPLVDEHRIEIRVSKAKPKSYTPEQD